MNNPPIPRYAPDFVTPTPKEPAVQIPPVPQQTMTRRRKAKATDDPPRPFSDYLCHTDTRASEPMANVLEGFKRTATPEQWQALLGVLPVEKMLRGDV